MPHPVFASYAQLDTDDYLKRFIRDLRVELRSRLGGASVEGMAFFDRDTVQAGDRWSDAITAEVNAADVLLCLMSPTYFTREWCGRELGAFLRRQERLAEDAQGTRFIFPIWWQVPAAPRPLPRRLGEYHHRDGGFPPDYESSGVRGLARRRRWGQFTQVVDRLAELIAQTLSQQHRLPPGEAVADILEIANAFDEQQPYDVYVLALTPGGGDWAPGTAAMTVAAAAEKTAHALEVVIRGMQTGPGLEARLDAAVADEQVLLVVADAAVPPDALARAVNARRLPNLAVLLVDAGIPAVGADAWLAQLPPGAFAAAAAASLVRVTAAAGMQAEMQRLVDEARLRMQAPAPAAAVVDPDLSRNASAQGIALGVQPHLAGPGAEVRR